MDLTRQERFITSLCHQSTIPRSVSNQSYGFEVKDFNALLNPIYKGSVALIDVWSSGKFNATRSIQISSGSKSIDKITIYWHLPRIYDGPPSRAFISGDTHRSRMLIHIMEIL